MTMTASITNQPEDIDRLTDTLREIELTAEGRTPQKELVFVTNEEIIQTLEDPVRLAILKTMKKGVQDIITTRMRDDETGDLIIRQREVKRHALSVIEIVKLSAMDDELEAVTKNQVYHHLPRLIEAGLIIKYGTVTTGKRTTDYYRRTAKGFVIATTPRLTGARLLKGRVKQAIDRLNDVFGYNFSEDEKKRLSELVVKAWTIESAGRETIAKMIKGDVVDSDVLDLYEFLLNVHATGIDKWIETQKQIRAILFPEK
ncbi:MAG: hypothetical protein K9W43_01335 [Candidatus Thorarchaeota archaeon]|nr:hypothetical protein [Candidatus Thorarchaeota archaeon]